MGSFEWMELQTLTSDINASRSRLAAARANKDSRLIRVLEAEITEAEARRDRLLASITTNLAGPGDAAQNQPATNGADTTETVEAVPAVTETAEVGASAPVVDEPAAADDGGAVEDQSLSQPAGGPAAGADAIVPAGPADSAEGGNIVWDQLTPSDIERAQAALGVRREEMLARHAEELKALEAEQAELEGLEKAINSFLQRLNKAPGQADEPKADAA